jgi:hypothetical protein
VTGKANAFLSRMRWREWFVCSFRFCVTLANELVFRPQIKQEGVCLARCSLTGQSERREKRDCLAIAKLDMMTENFGLKLCRIFMICPRPAQR